MYLQSKKRSMAIVSSLVVLFLLTITNETILAQTKSHSAVIGGVKVRFKNAVQEPGEAERYYKEAIDLMMKNNVVNDAKDKDKEETYFFLGAVYYYMREYDKAFDAFQKSLSFGKRFLEKGEHISGGIELFRSKRV